MNIGIMCHSGCGGSVRIALELAGELARRGHRIHVFSRTTPFGGSYQPPPQVVLHRMHSTFDCHPAHLSLNWPADDLEKFRSLVLRTMARESLEILHFHYAVPFASLALQIKEVMGAAAPVLVGTLHGTDVTVCGGDPDTGPFISRALAQMDCLTTVSWNHASLAADLFALPVLPEVIPNFIDLAKFQPTPQKQTMRWGRALAPALYRPIIVHISNFRKVKAISDVGRIFLGIRARMEAEFWLVGDGEDRDELNTFLESHGLVEDVRFLGLTREVAAILRQTHLLLLHSHYESFCLAALEAMACGVPVLATRVGGLPEVVVHGRTGYLVPFGDHETAVELAVGLLSHQGRYSAMSRAAVVRAGKFGRDLVVSRYENLYRSLLASPNSTLKSA